MHHWWKHKRGQPLFNNFNQNYILQIYLPSDSSIPLRGIYARNISVWAWNKAWSRLFMASLFVVWRNKSNLLISRGWLRRSWSMHRMEYHVRVKTVRKAFKAAYFPSVLSHTATFFPLHVFYTSNNTYMQHSMNFFPPWDLCNDHTLLFDYLLRIILIPIFLLLLNSQFL